MTQRRQKAASAPGRVRVGAGSLRGSVLAVPERAGLRPTANRVRERAFDWLQGVLPDARCLDLFAGSGAMGIEALSRGAEQVCFIERDAELADALRTNLARLQQPIDVRCADALSLLAEPAPASFDVVFVDPPFDAGIWQTVLHALTTSNWPSAAAWLHVEVPTGTEICMPRPWVRTREARAGSVVQILYRRQ